MKQSRRDFLSAAADFGFYSCLSLAAPLALPALGQRVTNKEQMNQAAQPKRTRVVLLGTKGGPRVGEITGDHPGRSNPATLVLVNDIPYLVDAGYGCSRQLLASGIALNKLRYILITHHHSDHNLEYGALLYNAWITGLPFRIDAYGPTGLKKMTEDFFNYVKLDLEIRIPDEGRTDPRKLITAHDFAQPGVILDNDEVRVKAFRVPHPPIKDSFAFRFDPKPGRGDRSVVISGDTAYHPALANFAMDADVLVHEIMYLPGVDALTRRLPNAKRLREHLLAAHTLGEDVGRIAAKARVKKLVLTHFVPGDDESITDADWSAGVRKHFSGEIVVGQDLMEV